MTENTLKKDRKMIEWTYFERKITETKDQAIKMNGENVLNDH